MIYERFLNGAAFLMLMDDKYLNREIQPLIRKRFYGHDRLRSKYTPRFPDSAEREYYRLCREYMGMLKEEVESELPSFKEIYRETVNESKKQHNDSADDLWNAITQMFNHITDAVRKKTEKFGLFDKLSEIAKKTRKNSAKQWKKLIKQTLGLDIREDYYGEGFDEDDLQEWIKNNVDLISTIPQETLDKMREIIYEGYTKGTNTTDMAKAINDQYDIGMNHAFFIARDQMAKLNSNITQAQQKDAGVIQYP